MEGRESGKIKKRYLQIPKFKKCDFRKMTKINNKLNKRPVKRLQAGPKQADSSNNQLDKVLALEKLVGRLMEVNMEITMSKAKDK